MRVGEWNIKVHPLIFFFFCTPCEIWMLKIVLKNTCVTRNTKANVLYGECGWIIEIIRDVGIKTFYHQSFNETVYVQLSFKIEDACHYESKICFNWCYVEKVQRDKMWLFNMVISAG